MEQQMHVGVPAAQNTTFSFTECRFLLLFLEVLDWNSQWGRGGGGQEEEEVDATLVKETIKVTIR